MDSQKPNDSRPVPTEADIAQAEAEAVAAMLRGEPPRTRADCAESAPPAAPDFVPYVDDVPAPEPAQDEDDAEEYIPGELEKRVNAMTDRQWRGWQIAGGAALGLASIAILFLGGSGELSTYMLLVAAGLVILLPRYLERVIRRKLTLGRKAMLVAMIVALAAAGLVILLRGGFSAPAAG